MLALRDSNAIDTKKKLYLECLSGDSIMVIERSFSEQKELKEFDSITFWMHCSTSVRTEYDNDFILFPRHAIEGVLKTLISLKDATKFVSDIFEVEMGEDEDGKQLLYIMIDNYESRVDKRTKKVEVAPSGEISISCFKTKEAADETAKMLYTVAGSVNMSEPLHLWSLTTDDRQTKILVEWAEIAYKEFCALNETNNKG